MWGRSLAAVSASFLAVGALSSSPAHHSSHCKTFPGDASWPSDQEWDELNHRVGGNLVKTVPLGTPCHGADYDRDTCDKLQSEWQYEKIHMQSSSSVMAPFFANQSCDAFTARERPCELGNYVRYAVNATSVHDIQSALQFATERNIRLVIRNTGHDYLGRSTGAGSLAIWTHYLKDLHFHQYDGHDYVGGAVKVGAGTQGFDLLEAGRDRGVVVVGGECPTVGIAGGYTQGGGHSALSTSFGLSSDNVLNWEVVTADGHLVQANRHENPDLYWALCGGGGSTFGVVVSMTVKTHPDAKIGAATMSFYAKDNGKESLYDGIQAFHEELPALVDQGAMAVYYFTKTFFQIAPLTAYGKCKQDVKTMMEPFVAKLDKLGINYTVAYTQHESYYEHYNTYFGPLPLGNIQVGIAQYGARLIPRSVITTIGDTWKSIVDQGVTWIGVGTNVKPFGNKHTSSVHPAWRDALVHATLTLPWNFTAPWSEAFEVQHKMTDDIVPAIEKVTPGSGAYVNEADFRQPHFQETFWGSNYESLLQIKKRWDPRNTFYATVGVGSEAWDIREDGRMCAAAA